MFWSCWELQEPWWWRLLHFPCLLQLPMFVPYNPRCSNLNCIVVCYLRESARESSLFFGPLPSRLSFLVIWGPPFELLLFFMRRSVSVLRKNAIFAEDFMGSRWWWWSLEDDEEKVASVGYCFPAILPFSFVLPSLCSRARRPILNTFNNPPTLRIFCSYATGFVRWLTSEEGNRWVRNPVTAAG